MQKFQTETQIQIFTNKEFGEIRTVVINMIPWFIGKDITKILGYTNASKALKDHVDAEDKLNNKSLSSLGQRGGWIINESGLYSLILSSKLPSAKKFKKWVTSEVLPSIRKTGAYMTPETLQECLSSPDAMIEILQTLKNEQEKRRELEKENKNLSQVNKALSEDKNTWDNRAIINALIRAFGYARYNGNMQYAFNTYYKALLYKKSINLRSRQRDKRCSLLSYIREDEWAKCLSIATALCENCGINVAKIINETNYKKIKQMIKED